MRIRDLKAKDWLVGGFALLLIAGCLILSIWGWIYAHNWTHEHYPPERIDGKFTTTDATEP